jgi:hypothetical protein
MADPLPTGSAPAPDLPAAPAYARRRLKMLVGWVLTGVGGFLLAIPWDLTLGKRQVPWAYEGLTGLACAGLGLAFIVTNLSPGYLARFRACRREVGSIALLTGFGIGVAYAVKTPTLTGIGVMGLVIFVSTLLAINLMSEEDAITHGEVRTAITVAIVSVFLGLVAFARDDVLTAGSVLAATLDHFWAILVSIVGFYFTATAAEGALKAFAERPAQAEPAPDGTGKA